MSVSGYRYRWFGPRLLQYVVSLSKTFNPHCCSRLSCEMSTRREHSREGCLFCAMSSQEEISLKMSTYFLYTCALKQVDNHDVINFIVLVHINALFRKAVKSTTRPNHAHMYSDQRESSVFVNWTIQVCLQAGLKWWQWLGTPDIIWNRISDRSEIKRSSVALLCEYLEVLCVRWSDYYGFFYIWWSENCFLVYCDDLGFLLLKNYIHSVKIDKMPCRLGRSYDKNSHRKHLSLSLNL